MKGDRELCTAAVAQSGWALKWASEEMKGDRELCMAAVAQDGQALQWASEERKGDREIAMSVLRRAQYQGDVFGHVSVSLKANESFVLEACSFGNEKAQKHMWGHLPANMRQNDRVRRMAGK